MRRIANRIWRYLVGDVAPCGRLHPHACNAQWKTNGAVCGLVDGHAGTHYDPLLHWSWRDGGAPRSIPG